MLRKMRLLFFFFFFFFFFLFFFFFSRQLVVTVGTSGTRPHNKFSAAQVQQSVAGSVLGTQGPAPNPMAGSASSRSLGSLDTHGHYRKLRVRLGMHRSEHMSEKTSHYLPERMPDRMSENKCGQQDARKNVKIYACQTECHTGAR